jgi:RND family efflux transporter MFP subunit
MNTPTTIEDKDTNGPETEAERGLRGGDDAGHAAGHGGHAGAGHDTEGEIPKDLPKVNTWAVGLAGLVAIGAFAGLFYVGWKPRQERQADLHETTAAIAESRPAVQVATPKRAEKGGDLVLPADARPMQETAIYPRANGYLNKLLVDIGDRVEAGQLLAEISAPDVDADLLAAKASVGQANANLVKAQNDFDLGQATLKRYEGFSEGGGVTQQQLDERRSTLAQAKSNLEAAKANVQAAEAAVTRLTAMQGFTKVVAPFGGTITARNYDLGALMSASNSSGRELFRIADTGTLRVFVNVPQNYLTSVKMGQKAFLTVRNFPGREFPGTISRSTGTLDPTSRTLRYQIDVDNKDGTLVAGMYGQARLQVGNGQSPMTVPTSSLVFDSAGTKVWVVGQDAKVHAKKVDVGRDLGTEIEIASGLSGGESVVTNPGERLADGVEVELPKAATADGEKAPAAEQAAAR